MTDLPQLREATTRVLSSLAAWAANCAIQESVTREDYNAEVFAAARKVEAIYQPLLDALATAGERLKSSQSQPSGIGPSDPDAGLGAEPSAAMVDAAVAAFEKWRFNSADVAVRAIWAAMLAARES